MVVELFCGSGGLIDIIIEKIAHFQLSDYISIYQIIK